MVYTACWSRRHASALAEVVGSNPTLSCDAYDKYTSIFFMAWHPRMTDVLGSQFITTWCTFLSNVSMIHNWKLTQSVHYHYMTRKLFLRGHFFLDFLRTSNKQSAYIDRSHGLLYRIEIQLYYEHTRA